MSAAVTRWIVERMSCARTAPRDSMSALSSSGSNARSRDHSATYGFSGTCACIPTSCSTIAAAGAAGSLQQALARQQRAVQGRRIEDAHPRARYFLMQCAAPRFDANGWKSASATTS